MGKDGKNVFAGRFHGSWNNHRSGLGEQAGAEGVDESECVGPEGHFWAVEKAMGAGGGRGSPVCVCTWGAEWGSCRSIIERCILQPPSIFHAHRRQEETRIIEIIDEPGRKNSNHDLFKLGVCPVESLSGRECQGWFEKPATLISL